MNAHTHYIFLVTNRQMGLPPLYAVLHELWDYSLQNYNCFNLLILILQLSSFTFFALLFFTINIAIWTELGMFIPIQFL